MPTLTMTLGEVLASRAQDTPDRLAFTYVAQDASEVSMTYGELHAHAQAVATQLAGAVGAGSHVLLLFEPGLQFVAALFGCFQAGVVGVSAPPPNPARVHRTLPRLHAVAKDARVSAVLSAEAIRAASQPLLSKDQSLAQTAWIVVDELPGAVELILADCDPGDLAFIQYTSGSTLDPRGVMLTHSNLLANTEMIGRGMGLSGDSRAFSWLPPSHDMGLVTGILQPVLVGYPAMLMSPLTMLKRPARWLEGISRFGATVSGAPDFAYELAVARTSAKQRDSLDLSCWEVAFDGAEPVRARTLELFAEAFGGCGFRRSSFYPCYGLAEATLMVTGPLTHTSAPTLLELDALRLRKEVVAPAPPSSSRQSDVVTLVGCGEPGRGHELAIVDAAARRRAPGEIGEIWIAGPSVASGYWRQETLSGQTFDARIATEPDSPGFLRTGDLGFVRDGQLFIVGRSKDVIILSGHTYHPHDIEVIAESAHPHLRAHCSAAFAIEASGAAPYPAIVLEIDNNPQADLLDVVQAVRHRVVGELDVQLARITLVDAGAVSKTTSGKIQRALCRRQLLAGDFQPLCDWQRR
jgi:acyl-CoA synthetase (AMP-forming)/AMP-acid ligase II